VLTGRGADIIIIDDPLKPEEALSQAQRRAANEWFDHTLYSRLNDKRKGAIVLIMHLTLVRPWCRCRYIVRPAPEVPADVKDVN